MVPIPTTKMLYGINIPEDNPEVPKIFKLLSPDQKFVELLRDIFNKKINSKQKWSAEEIKLVFEQSISDALLDNKK